MIDRERYVKPDRFTRILYTDLSAKKL